MHEDKLFVRWADCAIALRFTASFLFKFKCVSPSFRLIFLHQVLRGGQGERHGHLPCVWLPELRPKHAAGHGGGRGSRGRRGGRHLVHWRRVWPDQAKVLPGLLSETGWRAGQSWHPHSVHQGEDVDKNRVISGIYLQIFFCSGLIFYWTIYI